MIHFENLWWLLLLPMPWVIRKFIKPTVVNYNAGLKIPFYESLLTIDTTNKNSGNNKRLWLGFLIWFLLLIAAAGPIWLGNAVNLPRSGRDILLAIDISASMQIPDMEMQNQTVDRITVVKSVAQQFVSNRSGDRLGLILFGSKAYLETPLTFDLATVKHMLIDATVGLAGTQTAIGDAIGMAIKHFKQYPNDNKVLILLTDGVNNEGSVSPVEAAKVAEKYGIRIYTVGLGANQVMMPSLLGPQILTGEYELDEETLKQIAASTHGLYFRAKSPEDLLNVYQHLNKIEPRLSESEVFRPKKPLYYWPLGIALVLAIAQLILVTNSNAR